MYPTLDIIIAVSETLVGICYVLGGLEFWFQSMLTADPLRARMRQLFALAFVVGGIEEIADGSASEGASTAAYWIQGILTASQLATGAICIYFLLKVRDNLA